MGMFRFGKNPGLENPVAGIPPVPKETEPMPDDPSLEQATAGRVPFPPIDEILGVTISSDASDLHLTVGNPPVLRVHGKLVRLEMRALFPEDTDKIAVELANGEQLHKLRTEGNVDFAITRFGQNRFRISLYRQKGTTAIALRLLPRQMLSYEEIGLPPIVREFIRLPRGLVLLTGPTGSGKTTSLAAMLNEINQKLGHHIVTIEDPIEYMHEHQAGMVNQREVGTDVGSFADGLRRALRQDPDVIFVGEMRDQETMEIALQAAETGHLVFSTLHTTGAARTVDRIVASFPAEQQEQIRVQLSTNLKAVISQLLIPRIDRPGRIAVFEVMVNTPSVSALIRDNKSFRLATEIQTGAKYGMNTIEQSLVDLYLGGVIAREEVFGKAQDPELVAQLLAGREPRR
jgi:twitching motility protein PilT